MANLTGDGLRSVFAQRRLIVVAILVFLIAFTGFFVWRTAERARYWREHRDEPIRGWMTVGYIAHSHHVPSPVLKAALGLPHDRPDKRPLAKIAKEQNQTVEELTKILEQAIEQEHQQKPPPGGGP